MYIVKRSQNYPFATIDANRTEVDVPDQRLKQLAQVYKSGKIIPSTLEFVDIAGLVKGASQGAGLGNKFLADIRGVQVVLQVLRCYEKEDIIHVETTVDPLRDQQIVASELLLADLQSAEKQLSTLSGGKKKPQTADQLLRQSVLTKCVESLENEVPLRQLLPLLDADEAKLLRQLQFLTAKPTLYVCNVDEDSVADDGASNKHVCAVRDFVLQEALQQLDPEHEDYELHKQQAEQRARDSVTVVCAALEAEVAILEDEEERNAFLEAAGASETGLERVVAKCKSLLNMSNFYTCGPMEARSWLVRSGSTAPEAAGRIHSDLQAGFVKADVWRPEDIIALGSEDAVRQQGKVTLAGSSYVVQDGDIMLIRHRN
ncbi:MAG: hypothetical protein MHM6MM_001821 [Cercozoa sp. M6MM]